jgi:hypothetical protein
VDTRRRTFSLVVSKRLTANLPANHTAHLRSPAYARDRPAARFARRPSSRAVLRGKESPATRLCGPVGALCPNRQRRATDLDVGAWRSRRSPALSGVAPDHLPFLCQPAEWCRESSQVHPFRRLVGNPSTWRITYALEPGRHRTGVEPPARRRAGACLRAPQPGTSGPRSSGPLIMINRLSRRSRGHADPTGVDGRFQTAAGRTTHRITSTI